MKSRCYNQNNKDYRYYGGRGIIVYDFWKFNFELFEAWAISHGYKRGLILDRFPNLNGNYEPDNCRFVDVKTSMYNRRKFNVNKKSIYYGVYYNYNESKWKSCVTKNNVTYNVGTFDNEFDAAMAHDVLAIKIHGAGAKLNFPEEISK